MTRRSDHYNSDPAVYPYFEIYPKVQTARSRATIQPGNDGRGAESYIHSGSKTILEVQPWSFGWPLFRPTSSPSTTSSSVSTFISSPVSKPVIAYPVMNICKSPATRDAASGSFVDFMLVDPAVYPFFDVYPTVERHTPVQPSEPVPQQKSSAVSKGPVRMKLGYPVMQICKFLLVTGKVAGYNRFS